MHFLVSVARPHSKPRIIFGPDALCWPKPRHNNANTIQKALFKCTKRYAHERCVQWIWLLVTKNKDKNKSIMKNIPFNNWTERKRYLMPYRLLYQNNGQQQYKCASKSHGRTRHTRCFCSVHWLVWCVRNSYLWTELDDSMTVCSEKHSKIVLNHEYWKFNLSLELENITRK